MNPRPLWILLAMMLSAPALAAPGEGEGRSAPKRGDKLYVALGAMTDNTGREGGGAAELARDAMRSRLLEATKVAIAPEGEGVARARAVVLKHKLKGYMLQAIVDPPSYADSKLTVVVRVTMWSYPGKALEGAFTPRLSMAGVPEGDTEAENTLIRAAIERAVDAFLETELASRSN